MQTAPSSSGVAPNGSVQDAYYYDGKGWHTFQLAGAKSASSLARGSNSSAPGAVALTRPNDRAAQPSIPLV